MKNKTEDILHSLPSHKLLFVEIALFAIMVIIILSILLDDNLAAKYTTTEGGSNTGRVAAWSVNVTDAAESTDWTQGKTISYSGESPPQLSTFSFLAKTPDDGKSNETACRLKVRVVFPQGYSLPDDLNMYITDERHGPLTEVSPEYVRETNTYIFTGIDNKWDFEPNEEVTNTMTLNFFVKDATKVPKFGNIEGIQVWVDFVQID